MQLQIVSLFFSLLTLIAPQARAKPTKRGFCIGSPNPIFKITNFSFQKHLSSSPDLSPSCSVAFDFADTYHGFSTKCKSNIDNCGGAKNLAEPELNPGGLFDGSKLFDCEDATGAQFRFWEDGRLEMLYRWTCDTPGAPRSDHLLITYRILLTRYEQSALRCYLIWTSPMELLKVGLGTR